MIPRFVLFNQLGWVGTFLPLTVPAFFGSAFDIFLVMQFIRGIQTACGASVDGIAGPETLGKTVTLSASKNVRHAAVLPVQKRLLALGYEEVGDADGVAGPKFTKAVEAYQTDHDCVADGEITAKAQTWSKLLGLA